jgi:hypothetical protein
MIIMTLITGVDVLRAHEHYSSLRGVANERRHTLQRDTLLKVVAASIAVFVVSLLLWHCCCW